MRVVGRGPAERSDAGWTTIARGRRRVRVGLGIDRLTMEVLGLANVREAVLFPRDRNRLAP